MASVSERPCGHRRVPHYCLYLSIRRQFNNFSVKHYLNKRFKYSILQCITQDSAHCRSLVEAAAVSSRNHNALSGIPPSQGDRRHGPTVTLTHRIPNVCSLSLNGILREFEMSVVPNICGSQSDGCPFWQTIL